MTAMEINAHYERLGTAGPPLVMLHGWGQNLESLRPLADLLSQHSQVFLFDLPGFGKSPPPPQVWDSFRYAENLVETMRQLGVERFSVLGHSFGGKVAMSLAAQYPEQVDQLVLVAASGLKKRRSPSGWARMWGVRILGKLTKAYDRFFGTKAFEKYFIERFGSSDYKKAGPMRAVLVKSVNEDFSEHLRKIRVPTLLLWGEQDQETPPEMAERMHRALVGSKLCLFPHKGHYLFEDCGHHLCAYYIRDFLRAKHG